MQVAQVLGERISLHDWYLFAVRSLHNHRVSADRNFGVWLCSSEQECVRMSTNDDVHVVAFLGDQLINVQTTVSQCDDDVYTVCLKDG